MAGTLVPLTNYLGYDGRRPSATVYPVFAVTATSFRANPDTATTGGVFLDDFVVQESALFLPDTAETNGVFMDDFTVEVSYLFEPDTIETGTTIDVPFIPLQNALAVQTISLTTEIPAPIVFFASDSGTAFPQFFTGTTEMPFPSLLRGIQNYEFTGDPISFAMTTSCGLVVHRPETVERQIRSLRTVLIDTDPYRLYQGRPQAVPKWDLRVPVLVSSLGHILSGRELPSEVETGADVRWIADLDSWDSVFHRWYPTDLGLANSHWWETGEPWSPTLTEEYTYYIGKEEITRSCVSFDEDVNQFMWSSIDNGTSNSYLMTVMMVVALSPVQLGQNYYTVLDSGRTPPAGVGDEEFDEKWVADIDLVNRTSVRVYPKKLDVTFGDITSRTTPDTTPVWNQVGVLTAKYSVEDFYADWYTEVGKHAQVRTIKADAIGNYNYISHNLVLGRRNGSLSANTANMNVFDINIWTSEPADKELRDARTALVSAYGVTP